MAAKDFVMAEKHLEKAKELVLEHKTKKNCKKCYDRGYLGITDENTLVHCHKCLDEEAVIKAWKDYAATQPDIAEEFKDEEEEKDAK